MIRQAFWRGVCLAAILAVPGFIPGQAQDSAQAAEAARFDFPARVSDRVPIAVGIPELPAAAGSLPDLTLEFHEVVGTGNAAVLPKVVHILTRSRNRIHSRLTGGVDWEWLFLQNGADPRRVSGSQINHNERVILEYFESDLRNTGMGRGWVDVLNPGLDYSLINELSPTEETTDFAGVSFRKLVPSEPREDGVLEIWWSDELLVPLRVVRQAGAVTRTHELTKLTRGVEAELLIEPQRRFPDYAIVDIADYADWKEEQ